MILTGLMLDLVPFAALFEDRFREWRNGPMRDWLLLDGLISRAGHERWQQQIATLPPAQRQSVIRFGMVAKVPGAIVGEPVGWFSLLHIDPLHRTAEVGAGIGDPAYWGGGYGSDAMLLICEYAFGWLDLRRLWLVTAGNNARAQRQVEKCGFVREAVCRRAWHLFGDYQDAVYYGLQRDDWPGRAIMVARLGLLETARKRGVL